MVSLYELIVNVEFTDPPKLNSLMTVLILEPSSEGGVPRQSLRRIRGVEALGQRALKIS